MLIEALGREVEALQKQGVTNPYDVIRKRSIANLKRHTKRPVLIYAADFLTPKGQQQGIASQVQINLRDKDYLNEIIDGMPGSAVDFFIQSPGGLAEATENLVDLLRAKFTDIRTFVPGTAKSAATMLALSGDVIALDNLSELGPTDPQFMVNGRFSPAGAILKQLELAEQTLQKEPKKFAAWLPILQTYAPSLIVECKHHIDLSRDLVGTWLKKYMFKADAAKQATAEEIAAWLSEDANFLTHGRKVSLAALQSKGVEVLDLRTDPPLRELVRSLYLAILGTFDNTGSFKLYENSENKTLSQNVVVQVIQAPVPATTKPILPGLPGGPPLKP